MGNYGGKQVKYDDAGDVCWCLFCTIAAKGDANQTQLVGESANCSAFHPRGKSCAHHILVVPKAHVQNLSTLVAGNEAHLVMLEEMRELGLRVLGEERGEVRGGAGSAGGAGGARGVSGGGAVGNAANVANADDADGTGPGAAKAAVAAGPDDDVRMVFHAPPFNSVDHLHLHVFHGDFISRYKNFSYTPGWPWCKSYDAVFAQLAAGRIDGRIDGRGGRRGGGGEAEGMAGTVDGGGESNGNDRDAKSCAGDAKM
jgi:diadenosine tetraphosphate (Ap4A) HIT family hydrolase